MKKAPEAAGSCDKKKAKALGVRCKVVVTAAAIAVSAPMALFTGVTPATAAVGCYGDYCSGEDPETTQCAKDAITLEVLETDSGRGELRWSPSCKTNWGRFEQYPRGWSLSQGLLELRVVQDTGYTQPKTFGKDMAASEGTHWTPMIYSPVKKVKMELILTCGDMSKLGTAVDCALNGKKSTKSY